MADLGGKESTTEIGNHPLYVDFWEFTKTAVRRLEVSSRDKLAISLPQTIAAAKAELQDQKTWYKGLPKHVQQRLASKGQLPRAPTGRWFHMAGCSAEGTEIIAEHFGLDDDVVHSIAAAVSKPSIDWHRNEADLDKSYMYITGHYIAVEPDEPEGDDESGSDGIKGFHFEQVRRAVPRQR